MSINPKSGKKCWSCKYCEDIGNENESDSTYYRKCSNPSKEYVDKCVSTCSSYIWDGKTPENPSTEASSGSSSSSDANPLGCLIGFGVIGALVLSIGVGCSFMFDDKKSAKEESSENESSVVSAVSSDVSSDIDDLLDISSISSSEETPPSIKQPVSLFDVPKNATVTASKLNVRSGPSIDYDVVSGLSEDDSVKALAEENGWVFVEFGGKRGWCSTKYLRFE